MTMPLALDALSAAEHMLCSGCGLTIGEKFLLKILDQAWHVGCVVCCVCSLQLNERCFCREGRLYCKDHFIGKFGTKCCGCGLDVMPTDFVRRARNRVFHVKCFVCYLCRRELRTGTQMASSLAEGESDFAFAAAAVEPMSPTKMTANQKPELNHVTIGQSRDVSQSKSQPISVSSQVDNRGQEVGGSLESPLKKLENLSVPSEITLSKSDVVENKNGVANSSLNELGTGSDLEEEEVADLDEEEDGEDQAEHDISGEVVDEHLNSDRMSSDVHRVSADSGRKSAENGCAPSGVTAAAPGKSGGKNRRGPRTTIKAKQLEMLKNAFSTTPKPSRHIREKLAAETGLNMRVIQVWFQNRRSKERRLKQMSQFGFRRPFVRNGRRRVDLYGMDELMMNSSKEYPYLPETQMRPEMFMPAGSAMSMGITAPFERDFRPFANDMEDVYPNSAAQNISYTAEGIPSSHHVTHHHGHAHVAPPPPGVDREMMNGRIAAPPGQPSPALTLNPHRGTPTSLSRVHHHQQQHDVSMLERTVYNPISPASLNMLEQKLSNQMVQRDLDVW